MDASFLDEVNLDGFVADNSDGTKTLKLQYPMAITVKDGNGSRDETVTELTLRRPRVMELNLLEGGKNAKSITLGLNFATALVVEPKGIPRARYDELDGDDGMRFMVCAMSFLSITNSPGGETRESD